nr:lytic transglycosylase domain-containing protein [Pseudomonas luteola]
MWLLSVGLVSGPACALEMPPPAYVLAAYTAGIPSPVLYSVALQESGTKIRGRLIPWPWTLNVAGESFRFANRGSACTALLIAIHEAGAKRVDAGIGQVNIGWNGHRFQSPCDALDPYKNLAATADILKEQYVVTGNWIEAAGRYHRPAGGAPAARYRAAFTAHLKRVLGNSPNTLLASNP